MRLAKKILKSDLVRRILCWVISIYLRIVYNTSKWQYEESEFLQPLYESGKPFIIALWHNRVVMMPYAWRYPTAISIFTSDHRDGKLVAYTMGWFGFSTIFGSTRRTDLKTMRTIVKSLKAGELLGMTPDGPRGPRMRLKPGVISIAKLAGVPIIPVAYSCSRCKVLDTWDNLIVPLPFSRGVFLWGEPIDIAPRATEEQLEEARVTLETRMWELSAEADRRCGHKPVEPASWDDFRRGVRDQQ